MTECRSQKDNVVVQPSRTLSENPWRINDRVKVDRLAAARPVITNALKTTHSTREHVFNEPADNIRSLLLAKLNLFAKQLGVMGVFR
jgi:hypothetical protein